MSQMFIAEMRVNEVLYFPERDGMSAKSVLKGYTTGLDPYYATVEVFGHQAEHVNSSLKKGSLISIAGVLQVKNKTGHDGNVQYFTVIRAVRPIEFISGIKNVVERINLPSPRSSADVKAAKDAVAGVVQGFGVEVLPIQNLSFMALLVERRQDEKLKPIHDWIVSLARHFKD